MSQHISPQLMKIYEDTLYSVSIDAQHFAIELGTSDGPLHQWLQSQGIYTAALISAYNPYSEPRSEEENRRCDQKLQNELRSQGYQFYCGEGRSKDGDWNEPSVFVVNIDRRNACLLARRYLQNAFVFVQSSGSQINAEIVPGQE